MGFPLKNRVLFAVSGFVLLALLQSCAKSTENVDGSMSLDTTTSSTACIVSSKRTHSLAVSALSDRGKLDDNQDLSIRVSLALNNRQDLKELLENLYDPKSPEFHHFLTPDEFRARYAPSVEQVESVEAYLASHGLHSFELSPVGYLLKAQGAPSAVGSAFATELHQYQDVSGGKYFASARPASLPASLPIVTVAGLDNIRRHTPNIRYAEHASPNTTGSGPAGGLSPSDIDTVYNLPGAETGTGQTLALVEYDGYTASDVSTYDTFFSLTAVPLTNVLVDSATGAAGSNADEVTLDIEMMNAIAPGATGIRVYEAPNTFTGTLDLYNQIVTDNDVKQVSISWGEPESDLTAGDLASENTYFSQMAADGMSVFVASGDSGACSGTALSVNDPATQPEVTAVGGTSMTLAAGPSYGSETSWNNTNIGVSYGGGGGISTYWKISDETGSYQSGLATASNEGSSTYRMVPDVSLEADPYSNGYAIYFNASWINVGGTSAAAPLWAGFMARVNQGRIAATKSALGFANTAIYATAEGANYSTDFHDIADGTNNLHYPAVTGYDLSTGWGSFNGTNLYNDLVAY